MAVEPIGSPNRIQAVKRSPHPAFEHVIKGPDSAPILVVCDPPNRQAYRDGSTMSADNLRTFAEAAKAAGLERDDFIFVSLCPPMPEDAFHSQSRQWRHVSAYEEGIRNIIAAKGPRCVVPIGNLAARVVLGRAVAIGKARGTAVEHNGVKVMPMLSPGYVLRSPEHLPTFQSDLLTLARLKNNNFDFLESLTSYEWREDISDILALRPTLVSVDTETTGLIWRDPDVRVLTVQLSWAEGKAVACPIDPEYWPAWKGREEDRQKLLTQLKCLLEDKRVLKVGHNLKFDVHMLRKLDIQLQGWNDDTQLMAFAIDENMMVKSLDECVRRWLPTHAGYADEFNATVDKSKMIEVPHDLMLPYACGDVDTNWRLQRILFDILRQDRQQYNCYRRILMPAIQTFANTVERFGMEIDQERLEAFGEEVEAWLSAEYRALIQMVPPAIRRRHLDAGKDLKFSRPAFVKDVLFDKEGFNLTPVVWTKSTEKLPADQREPSTSAKDHLPYFAEQDDDAGHFVARLIEFQKTQKLLGTYILGFWKYIAPNGAIYPSYNLHRTNTGRTASDDPNGQNFPKRGQWAKAYQRIFKARKGYKLVNCDLSQIELRIAAWMANDRAMLKIYAEGGDIHTATAKATAQLTDEQWDALSSKERKALRTKAKAVNFGFLYGMWWRKFIHYAKTEYKVVYTEAEAKQTRELFFKTYRSLLNWHRRTEDFVKESGFVRALHGAIRRLPAVFSNDDAIVAGAVRQAINAPVQRFGSDLGLIAMIRFSQQADPNLFRIIGFVHDALIMEVKDGYEKEGVEALLWCMEKAPLKEWFGIEAPIPLCAEADIGLNGGEMLEFADLPPEDERPDWFKALGFDKVKATRPSWWDDQLEKDAYDAMRENHDRLVNLDTGQVSYTVRTRTRALALDK